MIVTTLVLLLAAAWLASLPRLHEWAAPAAVVAAAVAGTTLPDLDLFLPIGHRSGLTHSVLPVAVLACWRRGWPAAAGLALGIGVHLTADSFPHAMRGYALVKLPGLHGITRWESYGWLAANAAAAFVAGWWLARRAVPSHLTAAVLAAVAVAAITYLLKTDGGWWALALLGVPVWLRLRPYRRRSSS